MFAMPLFEHENFPSLRSGRSSCLRLSMELFDTINEFNSLQFFTAFRHSSVSALSEAISANKLLVKGASNTPSKLLNRFPETFNTRIVSQHLLKGSKPFDSTRLFECFNHFNCFKFSKIMKHFYWSSHVHACMWDVACAVFFFFKLLRYSNLDRVLPISGKP